MIPEIMKTAVRYVNLERAVKVYLSRARESGNLPHIRTHCAHALQSVQDFTSNLPGEQKELFNPYVKNLEAGIESRRVRLHKKVQLGGIAA
jgi:hypothetical protein